METPQGISTSKHRHSGPHGTLSYNLNDGEIHTFLLSSIPKQNNKIFISILKCVKNAERVIFIHFFSYPRRKKIPNSFFLEMGHQNKIKSSVC